MPERENPHFISRDDETIQGHVPCTTIGDDQLPQLAFHTPANQRMCVQIIDRRLNGSDGIRCGGGILLAREMERALDVL